MPDPRSRYTAALSSGQLEADPAQERAIQSLQRVHTELASQSRKRGWLRRSPEQPVQGVYLHGGVGRGKTLLMDMFAQTLPADQVRRAHFHHFMRDTHAAITAHQKVADPLEPIAKALAQRARVLCFDEFFVNDVADAMILGRLTSKLFAHGLTLVATSNLAPDDLYRHGLQRDRFLPAIAALKAHCEVLSVDGNVDYRLRELRRASTYHHPLGPATEQQMSRHFSRLTAGASPAAAQLDVLGRPLTALGMDHGLAWFDFATLCEGPRAAPDYIELAREFGTVLLSGVPQLDRDADNAARRFLHLIDEFYDRRVKLILSAAVPMNQLYAGQRLVFEFARAYSRLQEMQTEAYLAQPHQPL